MAVERNQFYQKPSPRNRLLAASPGRLRPTEPPRLAPPARAASPAQSPHDWRLLGDRRGCPSVRLAAVHASLPSDLLSTFTMLNLSSTSTSSEITFSSLLLAFPSCSSLSSSSTASLLLLFLLFSAFSFFSLFLPLLPPSPLPSHLRQHALALTRTLTRVVYTNTENTRVHRHTHSYFCNYSHR